MKCNAIEIHLREEAILSHNKMFMVFIHQCKYIIPSLVGNPSRRDRRCERPTLQLTAVEV